jgi:cytochrome P450 family 6
MSLIIAISLICAVVFLVNKYLFSFWTRLKVKQIEPTFLVGTAGKLFTLKSSFGDYFEEVYNKYKKEKFIGAYLSYSPILVINDPELIQNILISDFSTFHDRPTPGDAAENFPLVGNLFNLRGQKWRDLRIKLSPAFTSGKLKVMFPIMRDCGQVLQDYVAKQIKGGTTVFEFKDLCARFTINNISSVAFGVENDCINDPDNIFRKMGLKLFEPSMRNAVINTMAFFTPKLFTKLKIPPFPADLEEFIYRLVNDTVAYREKNNVQRNDFMQLMIQLKNQGYVSADKDDDKDEHEWKGEKDKLEVKKMTIDEMAAQAFIFFGAGFETSSSTMAFSLFELARNKEVQRKTQEEIDEVMKKSPTNEFTYDLLNDMKYLDCVIDETLRKYPILPALFRVGTKDYLIPNTDIVLPKDTPVYLPIIGLQRDPDVYDDPMAFIPERFLDSPTGGAKVKGVAYSPFGTGSRNCIVS